MFSNDLRLNKPGNQSRWTREELLAGFSYFEELNGRFPTAHEIDTFPYLPSSRSIQRSYGGLVSLRKDLIPESTANYTIGRHRSAKAKLTYANGRDYEYEFYRSLLNHFSEIAVHEHKVIRPGNVSSDFYIYLTESTGVVVDVFYAESLRNVLNVVNIKLKRYSLITDETYLVLVGNAAIRNEDILSRVKNKKIPLPEHVHIRTDGAFWEDVLPLLQERSNFSLHVSQK